MANPYIPVNAPSATPGMRIFTFTNITIDIAECGPGVATVEHSLIRVEPRQNGGKILILSTLHGCAESHIIWIK